MAQFGGQKNPPWAAQFAATAVSQPGHSAQSLDLNSLHCKCEKLLLVFFFVLFTGSHFTWSVIEDYSFSDLSRALFSICCVL